MARQALDFDVKAEAEAVYHMLTPGSKPYQELKDILPDTVDMDAFVRVAKTAIQRNPSLLTPAWRGSLLLSMSKAAIQGLLPDGKHGALIPRYDSDAGKKQVCWQPMVWGIRKLALQTGDILDIHAETVFEGEPFEIEGGDELTIRHKIIPEMVERAYTNLDENGNYVGPTTPEQFWERVVAAYVIITPSRGPKIRRWMTRSRLIRVRASSKADNGPWTGPFLDEMIIKTVMLFGMKWVDTSQDTPAMRRFKAALETDMDADFERDTSNRDAIGQAPPARQGAAEITDQTSKIDTIADQMARAQERQAEKVPASREETQEERRQETAPTAETRRIDGSEVADPPLGHRTKDAAAEWVASQKLILGSCKSLTQLTSYQQGRPYQAGLKRLNEFKRGDLLNDLEDFAVRQAERLNVPAHESEAA